MENICVAVRLRPSISEDSLNRSFWKVEENRISLHRTHGTPYSGSSYAFDHIFDESSTNASVYNHLTKDIIHAALDGFNGTAFAYGQTSSGKTFTMNGSETDPGVIPRAVKDVFAKIETMSDREFLIRVSYMEIYNEEINDLLADENQKLQIQESLERGVFVAGLREEIVNNAKQVLNLINAGEVNRHFGGTNMNVRSSRSHTIFRMVIESKGNDSNSSNDCSISDIVRVSVLNLVDLAGSERFAKTGADGVRLKEGKYINKSLMVLGNVINKLSEGSKQRGHIPYRDSKLTRILQLALGGNAKTSIICTIAPEEIHIEETKGTLQFASRAKRITNCVQVNEKNNINEIDKIFAGKKRKKSEPQMVGKPGEDATKRSEKAKKKKAKGSEDDFAKADAGEITKRKELLLYEPSQESLQQPVCKKSQKAGLEFPTHTVQKKIKKKLKIQWEVADVSVTKNAALYATACLEYLAAEALELSGNVCKYRGHKFIRSPHLRLGILGDEHLNTVIKSLSLDKDEFEISDLLGLESMDDLKIKSVPAVDLKQFWKF